MCGAVRFAVTGAPIVVAQCHCEECRRSSGTGHAIGAMFPTGAVSVSGRVNSFQYKSGKDSQVTKTFCPNCGCPIYGTNTRTPDFLTIPLGTFDEASGLEVEVVIFERDKPHWDQLGGNVVCFETQPDWTPET